jgi:hypothetical protein
MPGLPLEQFDRAFRPPSGVIVDTPILYEVWREYAVKGPSHRQRLLLTLRDDDQTPPSSEIGRAIRRRAERYPPPSQSPSPSIGVIGEWLWIRADLDQLILTVLPFTRWGKLLRILARLDDVAIMHLLTPLEELLTSTTIDEPQPTPADTVTDGDVIRVEFTGSDQEALSWLVRLLARIYGFDPDFDSERADAATYLHALVKPLVTRQDRGERSHVVAVSIDRVATIASDSRAVATPVSLSTKVIKADAARRLFEIDCSAQTWAVLDTGINAQHPAFADRRDPQSATRIAETFDLTAVSDDDLPLPESNKYAVDELVTLVQAQAVPAWRGPSGSVGYQEPVESHGTHVAGILAGDWPGRLQGICPDLKLWDMRVLTSATYGNESRILMALRFIRHNNDRAGKLIVCGVNLSLSLPYDPKNHACGWTPVCEEVRRLVRSGVVVVVAAGNSGYQMSGERTATGEADTRSKGTGFQVVSITDPANTEEAITVGATHEQHPYRYGASYFSGKGPTADGRLKPDLVAPGENVIGPAGSNGVFRTNGTSQAAPHVAGAAALLIGRYPELLGQPERIKQILCETATDLARDRYFQGYGLVDVLRAAQSL